MSDEDSLPENLPVVEVGRFERLSEARERGLVVSAMELPHWIVRDGRSFVLWVEWPSRDAVVRELETYEAERRARIASQLPERASEKISTTSLYIAGWLMSAFWLAQNVLSESWARRGAADSARITAGEWWRAVTALTLHGDLPHFVANLATGLLFAAFLIPQLGAGLAWLTIIITGLLGNLLNAWFYSRHAHVSIGASTAVFGALGLLVAGEFIARLSASQTRQWWQLIVPIGAGLGLLAFLGVGDEQGNRTDYMAHLWGFMAGLMIGAPAAALNFKMRAPRIMQRSAAAAAIGLLSAAWWLAMHPR